MANVQDTVKSVKAIVNKKRVFILSLILKRENVYVQKDSPYKMVVVSQLIVAKMEHSIRILINVIVSRQTGQDLYVIIKYVEIMGIWGQKENVHVIRVMRDRCANLVEPIAEGTEIPRLIKMII
jgi:hypothetical protein